MAMLGEKVEDKVNIEHVDIIYRFLTAYDFSDVRVALLLYNRERQGIKQEFIQNQKDLLSRGRWEKFDGAMEDIPKGYEWTLLNRTIYIRTPTNRNQVEIEVQEKIDNRKEEQVDVEQILRDEIQTATQRPKTDLSMKPTDRICITCGGVMAYEPICPGCRLGKLGFKGRYVCMEDMDHEFYVLREGIVLPNQGEIPAEN